MRTRNVVANIVGLTGCAAVAWGIHGLIRTLALVGGSCGGDGPPCPREVGLYAVPMIVGFVVAVIASIVGGRLALFGVFLAIGGGSLATVPGLPPGKRMFSLLFGGGFGLLWLLGLLVVVWALAKRLRVRRLVKTGAYAIGTVTSVEDTGARLNTNPVLKLRFSIQPQDGAAAYQGEKTVVLSVVELPRVGDTFPILFDPADRTTFGVITKLDPDWAPRLQQFFAVARTRVAPGPVDPVDPVDRLAKLNELRLSGALTEAEFEAQKARILGS